MAKKSYEPRNPFTSGQRVTAFNAVYERLSTDEKFIIDEMLCEFMKEIALRGQVLSENAAKELFVAVATFAVENKVR